MADPIAISELTFDSDGLIPAIIQEYASGEVLMMAFMNQESLKKTLESGRTWFWSRSRQELWNKGGTSGHFQDVRAIRYDCDLDCLLILVDQEGPACHLEEHTCFHRSLDGSALEPAAFEMLTRLFQLIRERKSAMPERSYTAELFRGGKEAIAAKVEEESSELIEAARDDGESEVIHEAADLLYHMSVLLVDSRVELEAVWEELLRRWK